MGEIAKELLIKALLPFLMTMIEKMLTKQNYQKYGDQMLDLLENTIADSETEWDDRVGLPLIKMLRGMLDIPDATDEPRSN